MATPMLGCELPPDWDHVNKYSYAAVGEETPATVERTLRLPRYRTQYDQGREGACVGFSSSWLMSIYNRRRYAPHWLWNEAKLRDGLPDTNPGDSKGTTLRAAMDVLRELGHARAWGSRVFDPDVREGIRENRWARDVDEMRTAIANGDPVVLGCNWYTAFDVPEKIGTTSWIGHQALGRVRGRHAVCIYRSSDRRQAFGLVNSWGYGYPLAHIPYDTVTRLLGEWGEAVIVTDR